MTQKIFHLQITEEKFALFSLKYPSLLQFDQQVREDIISDNLQTVYQLQQIPSDTQMRKRLDEVQPSELRKPFKRLLAQVQRSKRLELFQYYEGRYLVPMDGKRITHRFEWANDHVLNDSHPDCLVNVLEHWEEHDNGKKQHWVMAIRGRPLYLIHPNVAWVGFDSLPSWPLRSLIP